MSNTIRVKCVKCNDMFDKDPKLAKPIMLCPKCDGHINDGLLEGLPEGFCDVFNSFTGGVK